VIEKSKDSAEKMKTYLGIAGERHRVLMSAAKKGDRQGAANAVAGYRLAVTGADECYNQLQKENKNPKKNVTLLFKTLRQQVSEMLREMEKVSDEMREPLQAALEVSQRVQDGLLIQMEKLGVHP
jgi:hypothetical protein